MEALTMNSVMNRRGVPRSDRAPARPGWAEGFSLDLLRSEPLLVNSGLLLLLVFLAFGAGMALDPRTILGAPAWLKPAKFAISTGIYCLTLAWVFTHLPDWPRTRRLVGWLTGVRRIARASA